MERKATAESRAALAGAMYPYDSEAMVVVEIEIVTTEAPSASWSSRAPHRAMSE